MDTDTKGPGAATDLRRRVVRGTAVGLAARALYILGWVILSPWMVRALGAERFGFWAILGLVSGFFLTFDLGVGQALTKFIAEHRAAGDTAERRATFTLGLALYAGVGVVWALLLVLGRGPVLTFFHASEARRPEMGLALTIAAVNAVVLCVYTVLGSTLAGLQRLDLWNALGAAVTLVQQLGIGLALAAGRGLPVLAGVQLAATVLGTLAAAALVRALDPALVPDPRAGSRTRWRRLLDYSAALQIINLGALAQFQLPKLLLGRLRGLTDVAAYEIGHRLGFTAWTVPQLLAPPLLPAVSHLQAVGDREALLRLYTRSSRYVFTAGAITGGALVALAPTAMLAWMGPGHADSARVVEALGAAMWLSFLGTTGCTVARGLGIPWIEARYQIVAMVVQVALGIALIPRTGLRGALLAMLIAVAAGNAYFLVAFHRAMRLRLASWLRATALVPTLALLASLAAARGVEALIAHVSSPTVRSGALSALAVGGAVYAAVAITILLGTGYLRTAEVSEVLAALRGSRPGPEG